MAVTVGLLGFLAVDATLEGIEIAADARGAFGGAELLFLGAALAYLALTAVDRWLHARASRRGGRRRRRLPALALMVAIGIGLHNLGEGLAIGSAYAVGALALGAFLVVGFAIHNTTEGLAIVAPLAARDRQSWAAGGARADRRRAGDPRRVDRRRGLQPELAALLLGVGVGAIVQVIVQLVPAIRDRPATRSTRQRRRHPRRRRDPLPDRPARQRLMAASGSGARAPPTYYTSK